MSLATIRNNLRACAAAGFSSDRREAKREDVREREHFVVMVRDDNMAPCWVRNLSAGRGVGLWVPEALVDGESIAIAGLKDGIMVHCRVLWCREHPEGGFVAGATVTSETGL